MYLTKTTTWNQVDSIGLAFNRTKRLPASGHLRLVLIHGLQFKCDKSCQGWNKSQT